MLHRVYSNRFQVSNANNSDTFVYINIKMDDKGNNFEFDTVFFIYLFFYLFIYFIFLHFAGDY